MRSSKKDWSAYLVFGSAAAGFLFLVTFVRLPHWLGHGKLADALMTAFLYLFVFGGGWVGYRIHLHFVASAQRERARLADLTSPANNRIP